MSGIKCPNCLRVIEKSAKCEYCSFSFSKYHRINNCEILSVSLLSIEDYKKYKRRIDKLVKKPLFWWLKSAGNNPKSVLCIENDNNKNKVIERPCNFSSSVRPVLTIKTDRKIPAGHIVAICGHDCTVIDTFEETSFVIFNEPLYDYFSFDNNSNKWEESELKRYLEETLMQDIKKYVQTLNSVLVIYEDYKKYGLFDSNYISANSNKVFTFIVENNYTKGAYVALDFISKEDSFLKLTDTRFEVKYKLKDYDKISFLLFCMWHKDMFHSNDEAIEQCINLYQEEEKNFNRFFLLKNARERLFSVLSSGDLDYIKELQDLMKNDYYKNSKYQELYNDTYVNLINNNVVESKWVSEIQLYHLIKNYYPDAIYQYKTKWLGFQSLDIYIPSIKTAFEYQGKQHYEPVAYFGGEKQFKKQVENDKKKQMLCEENKVRLIYWKHDEKISNELLQEKLHSN